MRINHLFSDNVLEVFSALDCYTQSCQYEAGMSACLENRWKELKQLKHEGKKSEAR